MVAVGCYNSLTKFILFLASIDTWSELIGTLDVRYPRLLMTLIRYIGVALM